MSDNPFSINGVRVEKWNPNENDKNNCYWNIAKNQLDKDASAQEINALTNKIRQTTEKKNAAIAQRNGVLYEGDEVFLPLECAMDEIQTGVTDRQKKWESAQKNLTDSQTALTKANDDVQKALADYHTAQANFSGVEKENVRYETLQYSVNQAREAYIKAVNAQRESQREADKASGDFQSRQKDLSNLQNELTGLRDEYSGEKDDYKKELSALEGHISGLQDNVKNSRKTLSDAGKVRIKAQNAQAIAKDLGFTIGEDGKLQLEKDPDVTKLHAALWASKDTKSVTLQDGGKSKYVVYTDGTSAKYEKDEKTGKWKANPSLTYTKEDTEKLHPPKAGSSAKGDKKGGAKDDRGEKEEKFPSDMNLALTDIQKNVGRDYLKNSKYYTTISGQLLSQKDSDGLVIDADTQKKMYAELKGVEQKIGNMRNSLDTGSDDYNKDLARYCKHQKVDLASMYLGKIDTMGVEDATKEMDTYLANIESIMKKKSGADEKWNKLVSNELSPIEKLMLKEKYGKTDVSAIKNYSKDINLAYSSLSQYDGSDKKSSMFKQTSDKYDAWLKSLDEIANAKDIDSHLETTGSKNDKKAKELISLYNDFMQNHYKGGFLFDNSHDRLKKQTESIIKNYLYGSNTKYDVNNVLRTLRAECKKEVKK